MEESRVYVVANGVFMADRGKLAVGCPTMGNRRDFFRGGSFTAGRTITRAKFYGGSAPIDGGSAKRIKSEAITLA
jgi:hypothetical protein